MKNPHLEIERKFLIDTLPRGLHRYPHKEIAQGYLAVGRDRAHVRLRRAGRVLLAHFQARPGAGTRRARNPSPARAICHPLAGHGRSSPNENALLRAVEKTHDRDRYLSRLKRRADGCGSGIPRRPNLPFVSASRLAGRRSDRREPLQQRAIGARLRAPRNPKLSVANAFVIICFSPPDDYFA